MSEDISPLRRAELRGLEAVIWVHGFVDDGWLSRYLFSWVVPSTAREYFLEAARGLKEQRRLLESSNDRKEG